MPYPGDGADNGLVQAEPGNLNVADEQAARYFVDNADLNNPNGTRLIARILNHLAAMFLHLFQVAGIAAIPRSKEQLVNAINALIAQANSAITVDSITAGLIAVRTETYRPGYMAGANYNLPANDNDRGQFNGQQWQVIDANGVLGDRFLWRNGAGATLADRKNAGRWFLTAGKAIQIFQRGESSSGAGSAGNLRNIPTTYRRYLGNGSENARQYDFGMFRRLYFHATLPTTLRHEVATPISISSASFIAGQAVNTADGDDTLNIAYATANTFTESNELGGTGARLDEIWGEL